MKTITFRRYLRNQIAVLKEIPLDPYNYHFNWLAECFTITEFEDEEKQRFCETFTVKESSLYWQVAVKFARYIQKTAQKRGYDHVIKAGGYAVEYGEQDETANAEQEKQE